MAYTKKGARAVLQLLMRLLNECLVMAAVPIWAYSAHRVHVLCQLYNGKSDKNKCTREVLWLISCKFSRNTKLIGVSGKLTAY